jgi:hypothetical protein
MEQLFTMVTEGWNIYTTVHVYLVLASNLFSNSRQEEAIRPFLEDLKFREVIRGMKRIFYKVYGAKETLIFGIKKQK